MSTRSATTRARPRRTPQRRRALLRRVAWLLAAVVVAAVAVAAIVAPGLDKAVKEIALPLRHEDIIRQQAADKALDPALIAGVIYAESRFRDQTSHAGAARQGQSVVSARSTRTSTMSCTSVYRALAFELA